VLFHQADGLQIGEVEDAHAEAEIAEDQRQEEQGEADRQPNEDRCQHHQQHGHAEEFETGHTSNFSRCTNSRPKRIWKRHFSVSETPWIMKRTAESGIEARNGHMMARQMLSCERSPSMNEFQASSTLIRNIVIMVGKNSST